VNVLITISPSSHAYPSAEVLGASSSNPPFTFDINASITGITKINDRRFAISYADTLILVDMGLYALESDQPPVLSEDDGTDGNLTAIAYASSKSWIIASQDDGDILFFDLDDITAVPYSITLSIGNMLGPIVVDSNGRYAYIANNSDHIIHVIDLATKSLEKNVSISLTDIDTFEFTDGVFEPITDEAYFTTDVGELIFFATGGADVSSLTISEDSVLSSLDVFPNSAYLYVVDQDNANVIKVSASSHTIVNSDIDISANSTPFDIALMDVANPVGLYAFVSGANGMSVIDTNSNSAFDLGDDVDVDEEPLSLSAVPTYVIASSDTDGYLYVATELSQIGVLSENPWLSISTAYSDDASALSEDISVTLAITSDQEGTYSIYVGGDQTGSGTLLTNTAGNTSGDIQADTALSVELSYNTNSNAFSEGVNDLWVLVENDNAAIGRIAAQVTVDVPPDNVTIVSAGFGNEKIYLNFERLIAADISSYNIYVSADESSALTTEDIALTITQPESGTDITAEIPNLTNNTLYYIAIEAVDTNAQVSASRSITSQTPAQSVGVLERFGETGCVLVRTNNVHWVLALALGIICFRNRRMFQCSRLFRFKMDSKFKWVLFFTLISGCAWANDDTDSRMQTYAVSANYAPMSNIRKNWEVEFRGGFWLPTHSIMKYTFTNCCNIMGKIQVGYLHKRRYSIGISAGFLYKRAPAFGSNVHANARAQDRFSFMLIPMETNFTWRLDYMNQRALIPYIRMGGDYVFYRQAISGQSQKGIKFGAHGAIGLQLAWSEFSDSADVMNDLGGINDFFLTLDAQYQLINNFKSSGLDLSGFVFSMGLLLMF